MSYNEVLKANADMFTKAKYMLETDARNTALSKGMTASEFNDMEANKLINQKIQRLIEEKKRVMQELERDYNRHTHVLDDKEVTIDRSKLLIRNQDKELKANEDKLGSLKTDILTLRRQVEIGENEYRKKQYYLFFLKNIFSFLCLGIIVSLLVKSGKIPANIGMIAQITLGSIMALIFLYNMSRNSRSNANTMFRQDWAQPTQEDIVEPEEEVPGEDVVSEES